MSIQNDKPIFITGVQRSGSSIVAKIIAYCGVFTGDVNTMMENKRLKKLVDKYYQCMVWDTQGQFPIPKDTFYHIPTAWKDHVEDSLHAKEKRWLYKSARICQIWKVWNTEYPNAKWIIVRRKTPDIVYSCLKTGYMDAFKKKDNQIAVGVDTESQGWLWWIKQHEKQFIEIAQAGIQYKEVWPERMANGDFEQMKEVIAWLGLEWNNKIEDIVKPLLWKGRKERSK